MRQSLFRHLHDTELWASYLPRIPRRLYLLALTGFCLAASSLLRLQRGRSALKLLGLCLGGLLLLPAILAQAFATWKWKQRLYVRQQVLDRIAWRGDEMVLDVGCGSGLLLNGAALRLRSGKAIGIDIWAAASGGGSLELLSKNAEAEGVRDRIDFKEADARDMPFADEYFDVVVSSGALHHICHDFADHEQVVSEMVRVLKPGGRIVIWDTAHMIEATALRMRQASVTCEIRETGRFLAFDMAIVFGQKTDNGEPHHQSVNDNTVVEKLRPLHIDTSRPPR